MDEFVNIGEDFDLFEVGLDSMPSGVNEGMEILCCEPRKEDFDDMYGDMLEVFLKPAKSRDSAYECGPFPNSLLCNPYKYHMKIVGPLESNKFSLRLVFSDSKRAPQCENKRPVVLDNVNILSPSCRVLKFSLQICSFHYRRKEFQMIVSCDGRDIYTSASFKTFARRRSPRKTTPPPQPKCPPTPRSPPQQTMNPPFGFPFQTPPPPPPQQQQQHFQQGFPVNNNNNNNRFNPHCAPRPPMVQPYPFPMPLPFVNNYQQQQHIQQIRASLAIQLLNSLNPLERRQVMMNCTGFSN